MLHTKIKDLLKEKVPNITNFLRDMGLPLSYLGIRYFLSGKQEKMGEKGLEAIIDKLGYEMVLVPVKTEDNKKTVLEIQDIFINDFDNYLQKFNSDRRTTRRTTAGTGALAIEGILTDLDTSKSIDLGITADDLF